MGVCTFNITCSSIKWKPLFRLDSCADQYSLYQTVICNLMEIFSPTKVDTRLIKHASHTGSETQLSCQ